MKRLDSLPAVLVLAGTTLLMDGNPGVVHAGEKALPDQGVLVNVSHPIHENDVFVTLLEIEAQPGSVVEVIADKPGRGGVAATVPELAGANQRPGTQLVLFADHVVWEAGSVNALKFMMKIKAGSGTATMINTGPMPKGKSLAETVSVIIKPGEYRYEEAARLAKFQDVTYSLVVRRPK